MKSVSVVAAVIFRSGEMVAESALTEPCRSTETASHTVASPARQVFATQRGYGDWRGWWEFPGGKIEAGESPKDALVREIREELATEIRVGKLIATVEYDYPAFHLFMQCFACKIVSGKLELREHQNAAWLTAENLRSVKWLPADELILDKVAMFLQSKSS